MPSPRKFMPHESILFVTTRTEEGLPFVQSLILNFLLWGILARARSLFEVRICHFLFMSNHLHLLLMVRSPEDLPDFMRYIKTESSHAVNKLLGRKKKTIWEEDYDAPQLLTPTKVLHYIKYLYLNPVRAKLVDSIEAYPGVSSWRLFKNDLTVTYHPRVPRSLIRELPLPALSINEQRRIVSSWESLELKTNKLVLEPWAWVERFPGIDVAEAKQRLLNDIAKLEARYRRERKRKRQNVVGPTTLRRQSMLKEHTPETRKPRVLVFCENPELKKQYLKLYRELCKKSSEVYARWKLGDFTPRIPPGMFAPSLPVYCSRLWL